MSYKEPNRNKEYNKAWYESHKEQCKEYHKAYYQANKDKVKSKKKDWREANKEQIKAYNKADLNSLGQNKGLIRKKSQLILKRMKLKLPGYEIHHCFGYEDPSKFIYCSKALHLKIHQYLRDKNIDASSDHWMTIRDLVNSTDEFWYIKC